MNIYDASTQWAKRPEDERFETLDALRDAVRARSNICEERTVNQRNLKIQASDGEIEVVADQQPFRPTNWSFSQLSRLVGAPADYMRTLPAELAAECLQESVKNREVAFEDGSLKLMSLAREEGPDLMLASTSVQYGRIWDVQVADAVNALVERTGNKFYNPPAYDLVHGGTRPSGLYASDHDIFIFMIDGGSVLEAGPRAQLNRGFIVWNSEVGAKTLGLMRFLFNMVCGNHIIWDASGVMTLKIRHSANAPGRFIEEARPMLLEYANSAAADEEAKIKKAQDYLLPAEKDQVKWYQDHDFTRIEARRAIDTANREEGDHRTLWHAVQGLTAYARNLAFTDARVDLETRAGKLLELVS